jgi:hypothetical protein
LRIISGGLFLSKDGGMTWTTGISASGINASCITTGQLNTDKIFIMNGDYPSFRWDGNGISAYAFEINEETKKAESFNISKYVRYDRYGLYGIDGVDNFIPKTEDEVWENASFSFTWKGFRLKNAWNNGYVSIDSENDFRVVW